MDKVSQWLVNFKTEPLTHSEQGAQIISILSGKGGTGKTLFAVKFAMEIGDLGKRVLLVDCDYNLSNTMMKVGLVYNPQKSFLARDLENIQDCINKYQCFDLLYAGQGHLDILDGLCDFNGRIKTILDFFSPQYDFIILDCPPGLDKTILKLSAMANERVIVMTPDKSSLTDSYSIIKILMQRFGLNQQKVVVNRFNTYMDYSRVIKSLKSTIHKFLGGDIHVLGGLQEAKDSCEDFEKRFFFNKSSIEHKSFIKILKEFSEVCNMNVGGHFRHIDFFRSNHDNKKIERYF